MKYIQKLSIQMIHELMRCYAPSYTNIELVFNRRREDNSLINIDVTLTVDGIPEQYSIDDDYTVTVYDWDDSSGEELKAYRKKMLEYFGADYAIDYLLGTEEG